MLSLFQSSNLENFLAQHAFVLLHIQAAWNEHDRTMQQNIQALPPFYHEHIQFRALDFDDEGHFPLYKKLGVRNVPFLAYFHHGTLLKGEIGACSTEVLQQKIQQTFGLHPPSDGRNTHSQRTENE